MFNLTKHLRQDQLPIEMPSQSRENQEQYFIINVVSDHHSCEALEQPPASRATKMHILQSIFFFEEVIRRSKDES